MNYDLTKTVQGAIEYNVDEAMAYGDMPSSMLMSKYEETAMGPDEDMYENYARTTLTDKTPDTNKFEHEEPRGAVNRRSGKLQLQYYGHRGDTDTVYRPELFYGFGGPEDREVRGINVDPDMKEYRKQQEARTRFVRWSPDASEHITGGGRSETQAIADQQTLFVAARDRLKIFDRQLDGRQNALHRSFDHKSQVPKQLVVKAYGDFIKDYAMNPQRRANLVCKEIIGARGWMDETNDSDLAFARYTQICRRRKSCPEDQRRVMEISTRRNDIDLLDSSKCYKTAGLLMSDIVNCKKQAMSCAVGNMDMGEAKLTAARKTEPFVRDLTTITRAISQDADFASEDATVTGKTAARVLAEHTARQVTHNHSTPAHYYLNAEVIYKNVKPGETRKIKNLMITDADFQYSDNTATGKTAKRKAGFGAKLARADDTDLAKSRKTVNYKQSIKKQGYAKNLSTPDSYASESDNSQNRRIDHTGSRITSRNDTVEEMQYGDNASKERHGRGLGSKYMNRFIDSDHRGDEISTMS